MTHTGGNRANPGAVGMAGFGLPAVLLGLINAGLLPAAGESVVIPLAGTGGVIQLIAGLLEYKQGSTYGTTVFLSFGAFWLWYALLLILGQNGVLNLKGATSSIGAALLLWGAVVFYFWIVSFRLSRQVWATLLLAAAALILAGSGILLGAPGLSRLGGWTSIATGLLGFYGSFAILMNEAFGRIVLPLGVTPILANKMGVINVSSQEAPDVIT
jgi:succinate-acetate transporter protein